MEYSSFLHHEHELAELCRRDHDVVFHPDGRAHGSAVRKCRVGYPCRHLSRPWLRSPELPDDRQLLGGRHACCLYVLLPSPLSVGSSSWGRGLCRLSASCPHTRRSERRTQTSPSTVGFMEAIKELRTNGGGFFNVNGRPLREPDGVTTCSHSSCCCASRSRSRTPSARCEEHPPGRRIAAAMVIIFGCWVGPPIEHL